jgi:hypothetical protein
MKARTLISPQRAQPQALDMVLEKAERPKVGGDGVIREVTPNDLP